MKIEKECRPIASNSNSYKFHLKLEKIAYLKIFYSKLWTLKQQLNERYNWTLFAVLTVYFCSIVVGLYWVLMRIQFQRYRTMTRKY